MRSTEKTYEIVIAYVKKMIMNRDLLVGEKLPPEREIAEHLQVSPEFCPGSNPYYGYDRNHFFPAGIRKLYYL